MSHRGNGPRKQLQRRKEEGPGAPESGARPGGTIRTRPSCAVADGQLAGEARADPQTHLPVSCYSLFHPRPADPSPEPVPGRLSPAPRQPLASPTPLRPRPPASGPGTPRRALPARRVGRAAPSQTRRRPRAAGQARARPGSRHGRWGLRTRAGLMEDALTKVKPKRQRALASRAPGGGGTCIHPRGPGAGKAHRAALGGTVRDGRGSGGSHATPTPSRLCPEPTAPRAAAAPELRPNTGSLGSGTSGSDTSSGADWLLL